MLLTRQQEEHCSTLQQHATLMTTWIPNPYLMMKTLLTVASRDTQQEVQQVAVPQLVSWEHTTVILTTLIIGLLKMVQQREGQGLEVAKVGLAVALAVVEMAVVVL